MQVSQGFVTAPRHPAAAMQGSRGGQGGEEGANSVKHRSLQNSCFKQHRKQKQGSVESGTEHNGMQDSQNGV